MSLTDPIAMPAGETSTNGLILPARRLLISFDIDGTLETGDPCGRIPIAAVREARRLGWFVGSCSDRPVSSQRMMWEAAGLNVDFAVVKNQLPSVRASLAADQYLHIGDTDVDDLYARMADFDFVHVDAVHLELWWQVIARGLGSP